MLLNERIEIDIRPMNPCESLPDNVLAHVSVDILASKLKNSAAEWKNAADPFGEHLQRSRTVRHGFWSQAPRARHRHGCPTRRTLTTQRTIQASGPALANLARGSCTDRHGCARRNRGSRRLDVKSRSQAKPEHSAAPSSRTGLFDHLYEHVIARVNRRAVAQC